MNVPSSRVVAEWALRIALATAYLSAVADRFGLCGPAGTPNVGWGNWAQFEAYAAQLNFWAPVAMQPALAWIATFAEIGLGLALLVPLGVRGTRVVALLSGVLLTSFALSMTVALGWKAPLNYSVWSAAAASFFLACAPGEVADAGTGKK